MNMLRASLSDQNFDYVRNKYLKTEPADMESTSHSHTLFSEKVFDNFKRRFHTFHAFILKFAMFARNYEAVVQIVLMIVLFVFIIASIINAVYQLYLCLREYPHFVLGSDQYHYFLDNVFFVLIGVELAKSVAVQLAHDHSYVQTVIFVAITAVARNIVVLEYKDKYQYYFAVLGLMVGLAINYAFTRNMRLRY